MKVDVRSHTDSRQTIHFYLVLEKINFIFIKLLVFLPFFLTGIKLQLKPVVKTIIIAARGSI
jgi:hypothetical protein